MDFDASSTLLATGSSDSTVRVWDIVKGFCTHNFRGSHGVISIVRFHPYKLQLFSSAADCKLRLWDLGTSAQVAEKADHFSIVRGIAFSPDGDSMYSSGRDKVHPHRVMAILSALLLVLGPIVTLALLLKILTIDSNPNSDLTSTPVSRFDPYFDISSLTRNPSLSATLRPKLCVTLPYLNFSTTSPPHTKHGHLLFILPYIP